MSLTNKSSKKVWPRNSSHQNKSLAGRSSKNSKG